MRPGGLDDDRVAIVIAHPWRWRQGGRDEADDRGSARVRAPTRLPSPVQTRSSPSPPPSREEMPASLLSRLSSHRSPSPDPRAVRFPRLGSRSVAARPLPRAGTDHGEGRGDAVRQRERLRADRPGLLLRARRRRHRLAHVHDPDEPGGRHVQRGPHHGQDQRRGATDSSRRVSSRLDDAVALSSRRVVDDKRRAVVAR